MPQEKNTARATSRPSEIEVVVESAAELPSRFGDFRILVFSNNHDGKEHLAMVHGDVAGQQDVVTRIHSECLTGDVLGSLRCDCREQLLRSLRHIGTLSRGVVLYMRQEGRGIGLESAGIDVRERLSVAIAPSAHNRAYLATKAHRSGHLLEIDVAESA